MEERSSPVQQNPPGSAQTVQDRETEAARTDCGESSCQQEVDSRCGGESFCQQEVDSRCGGESSCQQEVELRCGGESSCQQEVDSWCRGESSCQQEVDSRCGGEEHTFGSVLHQLLQQQKHKAGRRFRKKTLVRMAKLLVIAKGWDGGEDGSRGRHQTGNRKTLHTNLLTVPAEETQLNPTGSGSVQEETKVIKPASRGATKTAETRTKPAETRTKPAETRTKPASRRGRRPTNTAEASSDQTSATTRLGFTIKEEPWTSLDGSELDQDLNQDQVGSMDHSMSGLQPTAERPEPGPEPGLSYQSVVQHKPRKNVNKPKKRLPVSLQESTNQDEASLVKQEPQKTVKTRTKTAKTTTKPGSRRGRRPTKKAELSSDQTSATTETGFTIKEEPWTSLDGPELNNDQVGSMDHSISGLQTTDEKPGPKPEPELSFQSLVQHKPRKNVNKPKKRLSVSLQESTNQDESSRFEQEPQKTIKTRTKPAETRTKPAETRTKPAETRTKPASRRGRRPTKTAELSSDQTSATTWLRFTVKEEPWTSLDGPELNQDQNLDQKGSMDHSMSVLQPKKRLPVSLQESTNQDEASLVKQEPQKTVKTRTKPGSRRGRRPTKTAETSSDQTSATTETGFTIKEEPWTSLDGPELNQDQVGSMDHSMSGLLLTAERPEPGPEPGLSFQSVVQHKPRKNVNKPKKRLPVCLQESTNQDEASFVKPEPQKPAETRTKPVKTRTKPASRRGRRPTKTAELSSDQTLATTEPPFTGDKESMTSLDGPELDQDLNQDQMGSMDHSMSGLQPTAERPESGLSFQSVVQHKPRKNVKKPKKRLPVSLQESTNQDEASLVKQEPQKTVKTRTKTAETRTKPGSRRGRKPTKTAEASSDQTTATTETGFTIKEEPWTSLDGPELKQDQVGSMDHSMSGLLPTAERPEPGLSFQPVVQQKPRKNVNKPKKRLPVCLQESTNQDEASFVKPEPQKPAETRTKPVSRRGRRPTKTAELSSDQISATTRLGFTIKQEPWTSLDGPELNQDQVGSMDHSMSVPKPTAERPEPGLSFQSVVQHKPRKNVNKPKRRLPVSLQKSVNQDEASLVKQKPAETRTKSGSRRGRRPTKTAEASSDQTSATTETGFTIKEEPWTSLDGPELNQDPVGSMDHSMSGLLPTAERPEPGPEPGLSFQSVVQHKPRKNVNKPKKRLPVSLQESTNQDEASLVKQEPQKTVKTRTKTAETRTKPASRRGRRPTKTAELSSDQTSATIEPAFTGDKEPMTSLDGPELDQDLNLDQVGSMDHFMSGLQPTAERPEPGLSFQSVVQHKPRKNVNKPKKRLPVSLQESTNQDEASLVKQEPQKTVKTRTKTAETRTKPGSRRGRRPTKTAEASSDQTSATTETGFTIKEEPWTSLDGPELKQDQVGSMDHSMSGLLPTAERPEPDPGPGLSFQPVVQHKPRKNLNKPKKRLPVSLQESTNQDEASLIKPEPQKPAETKTKAASRRERRPTKTAELSSDQTLATIEPAFTQDKEPMTGLDGPKLNQDQVGSMDHSMSVLQPTAERPGPGPELFFQSLVQHKPRKNVNKPKKRLPVSLQESTNQDEASLLEQEPQKTDETRTKPAETRTKPASRRGRRPTKTAENKTKPAVRENTKKSSVQRYQSSKISQLKEKVRRGAISLEQKEPTVKSVKPRGPGRPRKTVLIKTEPVWDFVMNQLDFPSMDPKTPHRPAETQKNKPQKQSLKLNSLYDTVKHVKEEPNLVPAELYGSDETAEGSVKKTRQRNVKRVKDDPTERLKRYPNHSGDKEISDNSREELIVAENTTKFNKMKKPSAARGGAKRTVKAAPGNVSGIRKRKSLPLEFDEAFPNSSSASTRQEDVTERRWKRAKREPKKAGPESGPTLDQMKPQLTTDLKETVSLNSKTSTSGVEKCRKRKRTSKKTSKGLELQVCPDWTCGHDATEDERLNQTSKVKQRRGAFTIKMEETLFPVTDSNIVQIKTGEDSVLSEAPTKTRVRKRRGRTKAHQKDKKEISPLDVNSSFFNQNLKIQSKTQNKLREKRRPLQCSFCLRSFRHISAFNLHKRIHTGEKPYECSVCTKRFSGRAQLLRHAKVHKGPAAVRCPCCDGAFRSKLDLIRHFKVHLSEAEGSQKEPEQNAQTDSGSSSAEAFRCSICSKEFRKKSTFKMHQRRHAKRKFSRSVQEATSISCLLSDDDGFSVSRRESAVVVTPTVFRCSICKQLHRRWCHYILHLQSHVSGTSQSCDECGQSYNQTSDTPRHCSVCCRTSGEEVVCRGYLKNICKKRKDEKHARCPENGIPIVPSVRDSEPQTSDHLDLDAPMDDPLDLNTPKSDHLDLNIQTTDPLDLANPMNDQLDVNSQTKHQLDLDTKTKDHLDLYAPTNSDSDLKAPMDEDLDFEAPTNDDLDIRTLSSSSAFSPVSGQTVPRLSDFRLPRLGSRFLCGRTFPWNKLWLHHRRGCGAFRCSRCKLEFHFLALYVRHLREHVAQTTHTCPDAFTDEEDLKTHVSVCNKRSDRLNCRTCGKRFSVRRNLKEHELLHKGRRPYACRPCRRSFSCPASLTAHLRTHRKRLCVPLPARVDEPFLFPYRCTKCPGRFSSTDLLQAHQVCHFVAGKKQESPPETLVSFISRVQEVPSDPLPKKLPVSNKKHLFRYPHPDRLYVVPVISSEPPIIVSDTEEETRPESPEESLQLQVLIQSLIPEKCQSDDEGSHVGEGRDDDEGSHVGEGRDDDEGSHVGEGRDDDEGSHVGEGRDDDEGSHVGEGRDDDEGSHVGEGRDDEGCNEGAAAKYSNCELCSLIFKDVMLLHQHYREHAQGMR